VVPATTKTQLREHIDQQNVTISMQKVHFQGRIHGTGVLCFKAIFKITVEKEHDDKYPQQQQQQPSLLVPSKLG
jgi:hypothetical protein